MQELEPVVFKVIGMAIEAGQTYIITNAAPGWVEYSSKLYLPSVTELLKKVKIISARGEFEGKYPGNFEQWKIQAFLHAEKGLSSGVITNIIALGDSHVEMVAAHNLAS